MAKQLSYALRVAHEKTPVVEGHQYRATDTGKQENPCPDCAAGKDKALCNALPPCTKAKRLDGLNVRYVDCGKAVAK